jgi:hypothetical protein
MRHQHLKEKHFAHFLAHHSKEIAIAKYVKFFASTVSN